MASLDELKKLETRCQPTWCPGCGDYGIWNSIKLALTELKLPPYKVVIVYGIGCSGNMNNTIRTYAFHGLHGRPVPVATGVKLANQGLTVIALGGDGDGYSEGIQHFIHACRRNPNITYIVHNNAVYGLTTGQTSPTSQKGFKTKTSPEGVVDEPINPLLLALASGASFVSRGYAMDLQHSKELIVTGIKHKGFALVDVLQPCATFNHLNTPKWYLERIYKLSEDKSYDNSNKAIAIQKSQEFGDKIPIGILYQEVRATLEEQFPRLENKVLTNQKAEPRSILELMKKFT